MKKVKWLSVLLCIVLVAGIFVGCGDNSSKKSETPKDSSTAESADTSSSDAEESEAGEPAAEEPVVSTYGDANGTKMDMWTFVDAHAAFFGTMVEKWNTANPDKTIQLTATTYPYADMHNKLLMSLQAGSGAPDICDVEIGQFPNVVNGLDTWLYPLDDVIAPYQADVVKSRLESYAGTDSHFYGVDYHVGATVMYYNMKALEAAGLTQADVDAVVTWDDYAALGQKYRDAVGDESKHWTSVDTGGTDWLWIAMAQYGEDWTGGMGGKANVELTSVKNMLNKQVEWLDSGLAMVSPDGQVDLEAGFQNILDGNIVSFPKAMWFMSRFINYMPEEKGNWYIGKLPVFEAGQPSSVGIGGTGSVVTQQSENKDLAAEFVAWAKISPEGETVIWNELGFDVLNTTLWTDDAFAHDESNQYNTFFRNYPYDVLADIKNEIGKISVTSISPTVNEQLNLTTLNQILEEGVSVDEALKEAQEAIDLEQ